MTKTLMIAALTLVSASAFASKARLSALQNAKTTASDVQDIFEEPSKMWDVADLATFEFGATGTTYAGGPPPTATVAGTNAEGGFLRSTDDAKWGAYVGHQSTGLLTLLGGANGVGTAVSDAALQQMENPLNVWYGFRAGDIRYGANLYYANSEAKNVAVPNKKNAYGISFGAGADTWNANLVLGLGAKVTNETVGDDEEFTSKSSVRLAGEYVINDMILGYASYTMFGGKLNDAGGTEVSDVDVTQIEIGAESKVKSDTAHFYYGAKITNGTAKNGVSGAAVEKIETMYLPVYFGLEADAASWLVLRASLTQNVLLNTRKVTTAATDEADNVDSTVAALGAGLKFGKLMLDGVMSTGTNGNLSFNDGTGTNQFMTQTSLTYVF